MKFSCWTLTFLANKEEKIAQKIREKVEKNSAYVIYEWPLRQALNSTPLFHAKRNRVELVSDFAPGNVPDIVSSLQIHPQGWVAVSRNVSSDQSTEWCCVHDIQTYPGKYYFQIFFKKYFYF